MAKDTGKITMNSLARMVSKGFDGIGSKMATKSDMDKQFVEVNVRLDRIENSILKHHANQISTLEKRVQRLENLFAIK